MRESPDMHKLGPKEHFKPNFKKSCEGIILFLLFCSFLEVYRLTGNGRKDIEFRFVDLEHAELCFESTIHDIRCQLNGNHCP